MQKDALRRHACVPHCTQVLYRFCALDRPRKVTVFVPLIEDPRDASDEMTELRHKERKWSRVQWRQLRERESETRRRICGIPTSKILRHESYF